jgi:hypothetical protein
VSALDAARILQLTVGLLPEFDAVNACGSQWLFVPPPSVPGQTATQPTLSNGACQPGAVAYASLPGDLTGQDFRAVLIGDCTGNWQPPAAGAAFVQRARSSTARVTRLRPAPGGRLRATLVVRGSAPLQSIEATLAVDPTQLRFLDARPTLSARSALLASNVPSPGTVALALASPPSSARGAHAAVVLDFAPLAPGAARSQVTLEHLRIDE